GLHPRDVRAVEFFGTNRFKFFHLAYQSHGLAVVAGTQSPQDLYRTLGPDIDQAGSETLRSHRVHGGRPGLRQTAYPHDVGRRGAHGLSKLHGSRGSPFHTSHAGNFSQSHDILYAHGIVAQVEHQWQTVSGVSHTTHIFQHAAWSSERVGRLVHHNGINAGS